MKKRMASIIRSIICLTAVIVLILSAGLNAKAKMTPALLQKEALQCNEFEEIIETEDEMAEPDSFDETAGSSSENSSDEIMEEESIVTASVGKYTGANILEIRNHHCNLTGTTINWLKKSYVNTSTGSTVEILSTEAKCILLRSLYTGIGPYAFAGTNHPSGSSTLEERINKNLKEVTFEVGSEMETIGNYAFSNNSALKAFDGENAVNLHVLGDCVFFNDRFLELIVLPGNISSLGDHVFVTNNENTKIVVPEGSVTDKLLQGKNVLDLPQNTYYTYAGADASNYSKKTFDLAIKGKGYVSKIYVDEKELITTTDIACGANVKIRIEPAEGYQFTSDPSSNITMSTSKYTAMQKENGYELEFLMTQDTEIKLETEIIKHNVAVSVTKNFGKGSILLSEGEKKSEIFSNPWDQNYEYGTNLDFSFLPEDHYHLGEVFLDNVSQGKKDNIQITMKENHQITVSFLPDSYRLTTVYDSNKGTITGNRNSYEYGTKAVLSIEPKEGYEVSQIAVNGTAREITDQIELFLEKDTTLQVDFQKKKFSITGSGEHVSITNNSDDVFEYGSDVKFEFEAEEGYRISDVIVDGESVGTDSSYKFTALNNNHTIEVKTERITYQINISADEGAIIANDCKDVFYYASTPEFLFQAEAGYRIADIRIDGVSIGAVESYTFSKLTGEHSIRVITEKVFTVSLEYDSERGQAAVDKAEYTEGENAVISLYPKDGFYVSTLRIDDVQTMVEPEEQNYVLESMEQDHTVYVIFTTSKLSEVDDKDIILDGILKGEGTGRETTDEDNENGGDNNDNGDSEGRKEDGENGSVSGNEPGGNGSVSGNESGENGSVSGNEPGGNGSVSGNESGENGSVSGNESGGNGSVSGNESGENGSVSGNESEGNGSVSENETGKDNTGGDHFTDALHYLPDKTKLTVDDEGNPIDKSASVYKIELSLGGGYLKYNYIMFHSGSSFRLPIPIREGYEFAGWYIGNRKIENTKGILSSSDKLEARWTPAVYRITYDLKGGMFQNSSKVPYLYCINKTTSLKKPVRSGYVFAGWYQKGTDIKITKLKKGWYYGGTLELEARWYVRNGGSYSISNNIAATGGKITYDLGGGYFNDLSKVKEYYAFMTSTALPKPLRTGYRFEGWYIAGTDVRLTRICKNQYLGDVKLVAMWSRTHYTITYCANKGKGKQDKTTLVYDRIGRISDTVFLRKGYVFTGWNTRANGTGIPYKPGDDVKNLTLKTNIKLYAQWQKLY